MIRNIVDLVNIMENYINYLSGKISFSEKGLPIMTKDMFLTDYPDFIVPYYNRNNSLVKDPTKTVLCFYSADAPLYVRLEKVFDELPDFKRFQGVIGLDITVTEDMDLEWQNAIMLLNQLYSAILGCNGIKIVLNARTGSSQTIHNFSCIPKNIVCATSFLGCRHLKNNTDFGFISKMLYLMPSKLMIYGKHDRIAENQLDTMGINYRVYPDFHRISKGVA